MKNAIPYVNATIILVVLTGALLKTAVLVQTTAALLVSSLGRAPGAH